MHIGSGCPLQELIQSGLPAETIFVCESKPCVTEKEYNFGIKPYIQCYEVPVRSATHVAAPHRQPGCVTLNVPCNDGYIAAGKPAYGICAKPPACKKEVLPTIIPDASCYLKTARKPPPRKVCKPLPPSQSCLYDQCQDKAFVFNCANQPAKHHRGQSSRCEVCPPRCEKVRLKEDVPIYCCKNTPGLVKILEQKVRPANPRDGPIPKFLPSYEKEKCHNMNNIMNWGYSRQWYKERDCVKHMVYPEECEAPATVRLVDGLRCNEW